MDVFVPPVRPTYGKMPESVTPRVLSASFGDGYRQDAGDGLNSLPRTLDLSFDVGSSAQAQEILDFFETRKGYIAFLWTPTGQTVQRQWKCTSWSRSPNEYPNVAVSAHFEQVFDV